MEITPLISVIVAVYNRETLLKRCLDSLVYQTLDDIEIVIIDDFSTDSSLSIANEYKTNFPNKVAVYSNTKKGVSYAKNLGIQKARGRYITFCDSDDYIEYWALEKMYKTAQEDDFDIVCAPFFKIQDNVRSVWGRLTTDSEAYLTMEMLFNTEIFPLVNKIFKRECFEKFGLLPDFAIGEDVSWLYPCLSYTTKIGYMDKPYYYYELSSNSVSAADTNYHLVVDLIKGNEHILEHSNPEYHDIMVGVCAKRLMSFIERRWLFKDVIYSYLRENQSIYGTTQFLENSPYYQKKLDEIFALPDETIPMHIYLNSSKPNRNDDKLIDLQNKAFRENGEIEYLEIEDSETEWVKKAIQDHQINYVLEYMALKKIYENGGIYMTDNVIVNASFDCLKYDGSFWSYVDHMTMNDQIFGAAKGNKLVKAMIDTYEMKGLYQEAYPSLSKRIRTILIMNCGLPLNQAKKYISPFGDAVIYPPTMFFIKMDQYINLSCCQFDPAAEDVFCIPVQTLNCILSDEYDPSKYENIQLRKRVQRLNYWNNRRISYIKEIEAEIAALQNSRSWKITAPLRKIISAVKGNKC